MKQMALAIWGYNLIKIVHLLQTKAAFTRQYNKEVHMTPYSTGAVAKKKRGGGAGGGADLETLGEEGEDGGGAEDDVEEENGDDLETDTMIKVGISEFRHSLL